VYAPEFISLVNKHLTEALEEYRQVDSERAATISAEVLEYGFELGTYILAQNPYLPVDQLDLPNLPAPTSNAENPWVRKSGVLVDRTADNILPQKDTIPAGNIVDFSYAEWPYLQAATGPGQFVKPVGTSVKPTGELPPDQNIVYPLNIVKSIRLRYTLEDRRYPKPEEGSGTPRDLQIGYILISYSGSNNG